MRPSNHPEPDMSDVNKHPQWFVDQHTKSFAKVADEADHVMTSYEAGMYHPHGIAETAYRSIAWDLIFSGRKEIAALASRLAEAERRVEIYATERDRQAKRAELMCDELVAIVSAILPDKISVDGVTYEYVPPDPHLHLKLLTKAINAARERVTAERAALSPRHQSAEGAEGEGT